MGLWTKTFGRLRQGSDKRIKLKGPGKFSARILGESEHGDNLTLILGGPRAQSVVKIMTAELVADDNDPDDNSAVTVTISGRRVGQLNSLHARNFRERMKRGGHGGWTAACKARVKGEWDRDSGEGYFGVALDLPHEYVESISGPG